MHTDGNAWQHLPLRPPSVGWGIFQLHLALAQVPSVAGFPPRLAACCPQRVTQDARPVPRWCVLHATQRSARHITQLAGRQTAIPLLCATPSRARRSTHSRLSGNADLPCCSPGEHGVVGECTARFVVFQSLLLTAV